MVSKISISCFDINYDNNMDILEFLGENIFTLECPLRIFDEFLDVNSFLETTKRRINTSEFKYTFQTDLYEKKISLEIFVLYDLSYIHDISLYADAYLLFINLEKENTLEKLGKITKYILDCCMDKRIYIIGIYKDKIIPYLDKDLIEIYLDEKNINYEYYQIKYNINSLTINNKDGKEKNCGCERYLRKKNKKENKNDKKRTNINLIDIFLTIIRQVYEMKIDNSNIKCKYEKMNECNSCNNCLIF